MTFAVDGLSTASTASSIVLARAELVKALGDVPLTIEQGRYVDWMLGWDQPTLRAWAGIIRAARDFGP